MTSTDQPEPRENDRNVVQQIVIDDLLARWDLGKERYRVPGLQVGNGRDMSRDALEEAQDLLIYMTGIRERDREITEILVHLARGLHGVGDDGMCVTCSVNPPCHTVVDITEILLLLGTVNLESPGESPDD